MSKVILKTVIYFTLFFPAFIMPLIGIVSLSIYPLSTFIPLFLLYMFSIHLMAKGAMDYAEEWSK